MKYLVFFFLGMFLMACEAEEECVGCNLNPKISLQFEAKGTRALYDSLLSEANDKIELLTDSLSTNLSVVERDEIVSSISGLRADSAKYNESISLYKVGKTRIDGIFAPEAIGFSQFKDSIIRDFAIPVNMTKDTSTYYFSYHELVDTLQVYYQREISQTLDGVRMRLSDIGVNEELTTFDSIST